MFRKFPAPINFLFPAALRASAADTRLLLKSKEGAIEASFIQDGILRLSQQLGEGNDANDSMVELAASPAAATPAKKNKKWLIESDNARFEWDIDKKIFALWRDDKLVVRSLARPFGVSARRQIILFDRPEEDAVVYGLGEKTGKLDKRGKSYHFWNVDVVADHPKTFQTDDFDPAYASIPFLITRTEGRFYGVFLNNTRHTWVHTDLRHNAEARFDNRLGIRDESETLWAIGAEQGPLELYIIPGPTLADVVRRFARLTGTHEVPPLWALGHHQCRWSYNSAAELADVARRHDAEGIPISALWMDIDYMDGFRVFTWNRENFTDEQRAKSFAEIRARGTRLVTIIDPGVKHEPGYGVFDEGTKRDLFCKTAEGLPYIGTVWPGRTVFPDFSLPECRDFWAEYVAQHLASGIDGIWNDMNDPSTGPIDDAEMRFGRGAIEHAAFHNQYADLMARATLDAFNRVDPGRRPFILTRSANAGTQRRAAVWTGDNCSNYLHLKMSIPMSINLALSGVSFNGPDVGGFFGDATEQLLVDWYLAGFLFPFLRNHSCIGTRRQEVYEFSPEALRVIRASILTRYKLLPYLYTLFHEHARTGDALMRPVSWEFPSRRYETLDDQFMIGPSLMLAPFVDADSDKRRVTMPPGWWYDLSRTCWVEGGQVVEVTRAPLPVLFVRDGAVLPCLPGNAFPAVPSLASIELHVFAHETGARGSLVIDDGETRAHQRGAYREYLFESGATPGAESVTALAVHDGGLAAPHFASAFHYGNAPRGAVATKALWPFGGCPAMRADIRERA